MKYSSTIVALLVSLLTAQQHVVDASWLRAEQRRASEWNENHQNSDTKQQATKVIPEVNGEDTALEAVKISTNDNDHSGKGAAQDMQFFDSNEKGRATNQDGVVTAHLEGEPIVIQQQDEVKQPKEQQPKIDAIHLQSPRVQHRQGYQAANEDEVALNLLPIEDTQKIKVQPKKRKRNLRHHNTHPQRRTSYAPDAFLIKGYGTNLCWKVDNGRYALGTLIVLDECDITDSDQHFARSSYSYDVETRASSWLFRPAGGNTRSDSKDDNDTAAASHNLYVVGHRYAQNEADAGQWRMVLDELDYGVTQPLTQVFWTLGAPHDTIATGSTTSSEESDGAGVDLMGMGQQAYSTRLFVTNEGSVAERDVPVVLRTEEHIYDASRELHLLLRSQQEQGQVAETGAPSAEAALGASVIPGKWSYVYL